MMKPKTDNANQIRLYNARRKETSARYYAPAPWFLPNGIPVVLSPEAAGNWVRIVAPVNGWVFRPLLACS